MKSLKILTVMISALAAVALSSCGGSSFLSEGPPANETLSTGLYTAGGATEDPMSLLSKDLVLVHVEGGADGYGDAHFDAGIHYCLFEFDSATLPAGHIQIKATAAECSGIVDCGYCEATQLAYPDCEITCSINTSAHSGLVGEYLEIRYVDKLLMFSDAEGSTGGALRIEGEALDSSGGNNLFDSTTRNFTIVDGGLVLDQLTPLTDVQTTDKFDYTLQITDMILDPLASSHDPVLPDDTAWVDIESRVTAQLPLTDLAVPATTVELDAGYYASNAGFWHDSAAEHDVLAFLFMFNDLMEFQDAGVTNYENCSTAWDNGVCVGDDAMCAPYDTERTAPGTCELICMDVGATAPLLANAAEIDPNCTALGGTVVPEAGPACLPSKLADCIAEYPLGGGGGSSCNYGSEDYVTVCTGDFPPGTPCDEDLATALSEVFDENTGTDGNGDPIETLEEMYQSCGGNGVWLRAEPVNASNIPTARTGAGFGVCQPIIDRFVDGGQLKNLLVRVAGDDIKIVVGDDLSQDPFSLYDQDVIPNGVASTMFIDGDTNWRYGLSARWSDTPPYTGMKLHTADGLPVDGADGVSAHLDIMRVKESALDQSCTDPDQNYNHDYKFEISLRMPLLGDTQTQGFEECGTGPGAMHLFYNLVQVDCAELGNYDESIDTYIIGTEETVQEARDHIYDTASSLGETPLRTMRDFTDLGQSQCGDDNVRVRFTWMGGSVNQSSPECVAVADRLFVDYTAAEPVLKNDMSYSNDGTYLQFSFGGAPFFKDDVNGFVETDFNAIVSDTSLNNGGILDLYDAVGTNPVDTILNIGRVRIADTMPTKSDGRGYHYLITIHLLGPDGGGSECNAGGGSLPLYFEIDGNCL